MDKRNLKWITWSFVTVTVLIVGLMLANTLNRPGHITLPDTTTTPEQSTGDSSTDGDALTVIEVTPETVQAAIATLARPDSYRRTVRIEQFWSTGSGSYELTTTVSDPWTRIDRTMPDGRVRHSIMGTDAVYVWYNNETEVYTAPVGDVTADNEQMLPTYEEILNLPTESIFAADYRRLSNMECIYVEAEEDIYSLRYWVSVNSGLLVSAEKLLGEDVVYRMEALAVDTAEPAAAEFALPDGTILMET